MTDKEAAGGESRGGERRKKKGEERREEKRRGQGGREGIRGAFGSGLGTSSQNFIRGG
jgi:hypothetical protein